MKILCRGDCSRQSIVPPYKILIGLVLFVLILWTVGSDHICAITNYGKMICYGDNHYSQATVPRLDDGVMWTSVSAGASSTCGVTSTASVICFGNDRLLTGYNSVPQGIQCTSLSNAAYSVCGLTMKGEIVCWAQRSDHYIYKDYDVLKVPTIPPGSKWVSVSGLKTHHCGLTDTNDIYCWGWNDYQQLTVPSGYKWSAVSAGFGHSCGLTVAGSIICWGQNDIGQLNVPTQLPPYSTKWVQVASGYFHTCALSDAGAILCWGWNNQYGQCDAPTSPRPSPPSPPPPPPSPPPPPPPSPPPSPILISASAVVAGYRTTCSINAGKINCWGDSIGVPAMPDGKASWSKVSLGMSVVHLHICAINTTIK